MEHAAQTIKRIKKNGLLIPLVFLGTVILVCLGFLLLWNQGTENPLDAVVERNQMDSISNAALTDEEDALMEFAMGDGNPISIFSYRLSEGNTLSALGLYIYDGEKWSENPMMTGGGSPSGMIAYRVKEGEANIDIYGGNGSAVTLTGYPLDGYRESWVWGSAVLGEPVNIPDSATVVVALLLADEEDVSLPLDMVGKTEAKWLQDRSALEGYEYVVALYLTVE